MTVGAHEDWPEPDTEVETVVRTTYRVNGRTWLTKDTAYKKMAVRMWFYRHGPEWERVKAAAEKAWPESERPLWDVDYPPEMGAFVELRERKDLVIKRLARWLKWRDRRRKAMEAAR